MGINSTEVAYGFGQMGSILTNAAEDSITSNGVAGFESAVFVAITFVEDTVFDNTTGLVPEDTTKFFGSDAPAAAGIDVNGWLVTDGIVFPAGLTIYGRWTEVDLLSGVVIAYVGY
tara:strand:- start:620 stop:967 length:348 start_codon:yes stop_codon:yes gene_type:complete